MAWVRRHAHDSESPDRIDLLVCRPTAVHRAPLRFSEHRHRTQIEALIASAIHSGAPSGSADSYWVKPTRTLPTLARAANRTLRLFREADSDWQIALSDHTRLLGNITPVIGRRGAPRLAQVTETEPVLHG